MVFKDLRLTADSQLVLNIDLTNLKYFKEGVKLSSIQIDTIDSFNENFTESYTIGERYFEKSDKFDAILSPSMFYKERDGKRESPIKFGDVVYVQLEFEGVEKPNAPCGITHQIYGVAVNWRKVYDKGMAYVKQIEKVCGDKSAFIDFSMKLKALELAVKFGDCTFANELFRTFFNNGAPASSCNCGR